MALRTAPKGKQGVTINDLEIEHFDKIVQHLDLQGMKDLLNSGVISDSALAARLVQHIAALKIQTAYRLYRLQYFKKNGYPIRGIGDHEDGRWLTEDIGKEFWNYTENRVLSEGEYNVEEIVGYMYLDNREEPNLPDLDQRGEAIWFLMASLRDVEDDSRYVFTICLHCDEHQIVDADYRDYEQLHEWDVRNPAYTDYRYVPKNQIPGEAFESFNFPFKVTSQLGIRLRYPMSSADTIFPLDRMY